MGAGAVGMTLAGRLAQHGAAVELFEAAPAAQRIGSRAICMQRETLEIWARLGIGERVAERGVRWRTGRTYFRGRELFSVELPEGGEHFPPFVNISQSEVEELLEARLAQLGVPIHRGRRLERIEDGTAIFATEAGEAEHRFSHLVGADGAHSAVRHAAGIGFDGYTFADRFLIADVRADLPFPNERHFHFDPPWNPGRQVLIHPQPDGVWRIDWQVPAQTDVETERAGGGLDNRIREIAGSTPYELLWATAYRFSQRLASRFRDGSVFLVGDAAHLMSPFGARGLNSGVADAENLAWKLAWVLRSDAPEALLETYEMERRPAAVANLAVTDATMRFMTPHGRVRRWWRNAVLHLAPHSGWFRRRVDSGRLAEPAMYRGSPLIAPGAALHGLVAPDVPLPGGGRLRDRLGRGFTVVAPRPVAFDAVVVSPGTIYGEAAWVIRPDGYVADSLPLDRAEAAFRRAVDRCLGRTSV